MSNTPTCSLSLELLGTFRLKIAGQNVPVEKWKSKKALLLLKYLAARHGEKVPSEVLIDVLWSDKDFETSIHTVHSTIYSLRKTLRDHTPSTLPSPEWIQSGDGLYWLDTSEGVSVDVQEFLEFNRQSEHTEQLDPERSLEIGLNGLALYRGSFLPENMYDDWTESVRQNCCTKYVELALRTGKLLVAIRRDYKGAAAICRTALRHDPYREELYQLLIGCLVAMGRSPEAVLQYNNCAKILRDEFGLEPCPELKALLKAIKEGSAATGESVEYVPTKADGVFVCDRAVFECILSLEQRRAVRGTHQMVLVIIALDDIGSTKYLAEIFSTITQSMRQADVFTQWSKKRLAALLAFTDARGAVKVEERIRKNLGSALASHCCFTSQLLRGKDEVIRELADDPPVEAAT